jgi:transcriptional regulator with XRE-family HTH domain
MTSSKLKVDERRRSYVRLLGEINHALNGALAEENAKRGLTITKMAQLLKRSKSHISRKMNGSSNMTLETLADLAYALNRPVKVLLPERGQAANTNHVRGAEEIFPKPDQTSGTPGNGARAVIDSPAPKPTSPKPELLTVA